jgi:peptidoglycan/LPS O-acetylase OafA/YrhL
MANVQITDTPITKNSALFYCYDAGATLMQPSTPKLVPPPYRLLEAVRGLAAFWVVIFHASALVTRADPSILNNLIVRIFLQGFLGVQVFFVVSGYCIASAAVSVLTKPNPLVRYTLARLRRIFPTCWASLFFFVIASLLSTYLYNHHRLPATTLTQLNLLHRPITFYLANLTLTQLLTHPSQEFISLVCWTLCYELAFYFLVGLALLVTLTCRYCNTPVTKSIARLFLLLHLLTFTCGVLLLVAPQSLPYPFDLWVQFGLGVALFDFVRAPRSVVARLAMALSITFVILFLVFQNVRMGYTMEFSRHTYVAALLATLLLLVCQRFDAPLMHLHALRAAAFVGRFSYSLYLINFLAVSLITTVFLKLPLTPALHLAVIPVTALLTLIPGYVFFLLFERPFLSTRHARIQKAAIRDIPVESVPVAVAPASASSTM